MRIAIAGISHEALNTSPLPTTLEHFQVWRGEEILNGEGQFAPYAAGPATGGQAGPKYASISQMMNDLEAEPVPILCANGLAPSGTVDLNTYLQLRDEIIDGIQQAGHLDGICLVLHGALLVEHIWSGETDLVRSIRAAVGNDVLISASFDLHGNLTEEFANKTDIWTVYRTAPHRDAPQTLERAMTLLAHCIRGGHRPRPVFVRVPMLLPGERATTDVDPMKSLLELAIEIGRQPGI
ncbi:MAG: M81 family metallopeptidase, partial [Caldilineaceae bacterium]|nr:M81 family metallopeptidase [Caldilineaceae bacterium]